MLMRPGDKWLLHIPSELGYGGGGSGKIPGGAVLVFELELIAVKAASWQDWLTPNVGLIVMMVLFQAYQMFGGSNSGVPNGCAVVPLSKVSGATTNTRVWMHIKIGDKAVGRLTFELFDSVVPKTADNFRALCTGEKGFGYAGTIAHGLRWPVVASAGGSPITFCRCTLVLRCRVAVPSRHSGIHASGR